MDVANDGASMRLLDRTHVAESLFSTLDYDKSGFIDFGELSTIASRQTPSQNEKETQELIAAIDKNDDGEVSREEFVSHLIQEGKELNDDEFMQAVMSYFTPDDDARHDLLMFISDSNAGGDVSRLIRNNTSSFSKITDNKTFMEAKVLPTLKPSLQKLLSRIEEEHLKLASGADWDDAGYRCAEWAPFDPLTWLAQELRATAKERGDRTAAEGLASAGASGSAGDRSVAKGARERFGNKSRQEQCQVLFKMMAGDDGMLTDMFSVIDALADKSDQANTHKAFQIIDSISPMTPGHLTEREFSTVINRFVGESVGDEEFGTRAIEIYERIRFSSMNREDKIRLVFSIVDKDESESLDLDEIFALGQILDPVNNSIKQARLTMLWLHDDRSGGVGGVTDVSAAVTDAGHAAGAAGSAEKGRMGRRASTWGGTLSVNEAEFIRSMSKMTVDMTNEQFNNGIHKIIKAFKTESSPIDGTLTMTEGLQTFVKSLRTYSTARQTSVMFILSLLEEEESDIIFIDIRSEPEIAVSSMPCAIHMDVDEDGDVEENVKEAVRKLVTMDQLPSMDELRASEIVTFDTAGERGGVAAVALEKMLGLPVSNLCGGLIAWVNCGGKLYDMQNNRLSACRLHPFNRDLERLIAVDNEYFLD